MKLDNVKNTLHFPQIWLKVLIGSLVLLTVTDLLLLSTNNPAFVPTVLLIGAFLVPVTFVVFIYQRVPVGDIPWVKVAASFCWGGSLGIILAGVLGYWIVDRMGLFAVVGVGLIEETAKLVLPLVIFMYGRYLHEADGLLFGVAAGMGFASLETMGYGFVSYVDDPGSVGYLNQLLLVRGLFSPVGHAAWTGIVCASLWRQRSINGHAVLNRFSFGAFILAVTLHSFWNLVGSINTITGWQYMFLHISGTIIIGTVSYFLLENRLVHADHDPP